MADLTHFDFVPLHIDPQSKALSSAVPSRSLDVELFTLNSLHRSLIGLDVPAGVPPPPLPVNAKRSAQVTKLKESGSTEFRKGRYAEAIRLYSLAIQMALARPLWEPAQLVREEIAILYANRAQAHMAISGWAEGAVDAETSVEAKRVGNTKAWWRRGRCLVEMGRLDEAREWVRRGLEIEGEEAELVALLKEVDERLKSAAEKAPKS